MKAKYKILNQSVIYDIYVKNIYNNNQSHDIICRRCGRAHTVGRRYIIDGKINKKYEGCRSCRNSKPTNPDLILDNYYILHRIDKATCSQHLLPLWDTIYVVSDINPIISEENNIFTIYYDQNIKKISKI